MVSPQISSDYRQRWQTHFIFKGNNFVPRCALLLGTMRWRQYLQDFPWLRDENENMTIWEIAALILSFHLDNTRTRVVYCVEVKD